MRVKMEARRMTASGLVYLFGEEFAQPKRSFGGETLLYSGQKVNRQSLANRLFEAALISLATKGYISLVVRERNWLFFTSNVVTIIKKKEGHDLPRSLERAIMDALRSDPRVGFGRGQCLVSKELDCCVKAVVMRVIEQERYDPWKWVVRYVMQQLVEAGCLRRDVERRRFWWDKVHWSAHEEAIKPLAGDVETLKSSFETFTSLNPELHNKLAKEVAAGIAAQEESPDD
jgi:hypothetical protein